MQTNHFRLRLRSGASFLLATLLVLAVAQVTHSVLTIYLPWSLGLFLGIGLSGLWKKHGMLPPPAPAFSPSPLLAEGAFAHSAVHFFPIRPGYSEEPPQPPVRQRPGLALLPGWLAAGLAWLGCLIPFFCLWASLLALLLVWLPTLRSSDTQRTAPARRLWINAFWLGLAGVWSGAMILYLSFQL